MKKFLFTVFTAMIALVAYGQRVEYTTQISEVVPVGSYSQGNKRNMVFDDTYLYIYAETEWKRIAWDSGWTDPDRIMPLGDSITAGYTDAGTWSVPFEFGYRAKLHQHLTDALHDFSYTGASPEPWDGIWGVPTNTPAFDLRSVNQDLHRGYGGYKPYQVRDNIATFIAQDEPDVILLKIGTNEQRTDHLSEAVTNLFAASPDVKLIVAKIMPKGDYSAGIVSYNDYIENTLVPDFQGQGRDISWVDLYEPFLNDFTDPTSITQSRFSNPPHNNHPDNIGYGYMADIWADAILNRDTIAPRVKIEQGASQTDPSGDMTAVYDVTFNEPIDTNTFTIADVDASASTAGTVTINSVTEVAPNDGTTFEVLCTADAVGTVELSIPQGGVDDVAGNPNAVSFSTDNQVGITQAGSTLVFEENFSGGAVSLVGTTTPDGNDWQGRPSASQNYKQNGAWSPVPGNDTNGDTVFLPVALAAGRIYTLEIDVASNSGVAYVGITSNTAYNGDRGFNWGNYPASAGLSHNDLNNTVESAGVTGLSGNTGAGRPYTLKININTTTHLAEFFVNDVSIGSGTVSDTNYQRVYISHNAGTGAINSVTLEYTAAP